MCYVWVCAYLHVYAVGETYTLTCSYKIANFSGVVPINWITIEKSRLLGNFVTIDISKYNG